MTQTERPPVTGVPAGRHAVTLTTAVAAMLALTVAAAAGLGGLSAGPLLALVEPAVRCATSVTVTATGPSFSTVTVTGYPSGCAGQTIRVTVRNTAGAALGSGQATMGASSTTVGLGATVTATAAAAAAAAIGGRGIPATLVVNSGPPPQTGSSWFLRNTLTGGATPTQPAMPVTAVADTTLPSGALPNYSTDADGAPGRLLRTSGQNGVAIWSTAQATASTTLNGTSRLIIDLQRFQPPTGGTATLTATLRVVTPGGSSTQIGTGQVTTSGANPGANGPNERYTINIPTAGMLNNGDRLELRLTTAGRDVRLRYDTTTHPSRLDLPQAISVIPAGSAAVNHTTTIVSDWGTGYCADVTVTGTVPYPQVWEVQVNLSTPPLNGTPTSVWNAVWSFHAPILTASGVAHNRTVTSTTSAVFGFCADRPSTPSPGGPQTFPGSTATWTFAGGSLSPTIAPTLPPGALTVSAITPAGPHVSPWGVMNNDSGTLSPDVYGYPGQPQLRFGPPSGTTDPAAAVANNVFFSFTVTAPANGTIDFNELRFLAARGGTSAPRGLVIRSSQDNFTANLFNQDITALRPTMAPVNVNLNGLTAISNGATTTFRVFVYSPAFSNTIEVDDLVLDVDVTLN
jgi:hypothetical protein